MVSRAVSPRVLASGPLSLGARPHRRAHAADRARAPRRTRPRAPGARDRGKPVGPRPMGAAPGGSNVGLPPSTGG